jgi:hypothetical protein
MDGTRLRFAWIQSRVQTQAGSGADSSSSRSRDARANARAVANGCSSGVAMNYAPLNPRVWHVMHGMIFSVWMMKYTEKNTGRWMAAVAERATTPCLYMANAPCSAACVKGTAF